MRDEPQIALLTRWCELGVVALREAREEIDALNVYPVPDGDTGTNLCLTFEAARQSLRDAAPTSFEAALTVFARGALLGARGNSGVILSQLVRAGAEQLIRGDPRHPGALLADTLTLAADGAYVAVGRPVEGTMLSVARAAAEAAQAVVSGLHDEPLGQLAAVIRAAAEAGRVALDRTPDQLEVLRAAGVVDAGGLGLCVLFDTAEEAITGRRPQRRTPSVDRAIASNAADHPASRRHGPDLAADGPGYEVMYLLDAEEDAVRRLRSHLAQLGDSLVVVGGDGLWNVHVHTDDVGGALEAGIEAGRPHRVEVTHFAAHAGRSASAGGTGARGVVAYAAGPGLADLFRAAGASVLDRPGARPSAGEILEAIRATRAHEVVVLPNGAATVSAAEAAAQAAGADGIRVAVIPTRTQVQGLAAVAVREPGRPFDADVVAMTTAAGHTRHGAVTVAGRDAMTMAGPCRTGDTLGVVEGDFALVGGSPGAAAVEVVERLLAGGGELVTLVTGGCSGDELAKHVAARLASTRPDVELMVYEGGQPRYLLLIGVE